MSEHDPQKWRMTAGAAAMEVMDAFEDEAITSLFAPVEESLTALAAAMRAKRLPTALIVSCLAGMVYSVCLEDDPA
jgi:hypothetical protein